MPHLPVSSSWLTCRVGGSERKSENAPNRRSDCLITLRIFSFVFPLGERGRRRGRHIDYKVDKSRFKSASEATLIEASQA
jgi:hypothetical protein